MSATLTMEAPTLHDEEFRVHYLADLLRRARARARIPHQIPLSRSEPDVAGLTQEETAVLLCTTGRHYREFERGRILHPDPRFLDQVGRVLELTPAERSVLTHLAARRRPAPPGPPEPDATGLQSLLDSMGDAPALVTDLAWNALAWNRSLAEDVQDPGLAQDGQRNVMLWMFSRSASARFPGIEEDYRTLVGRVRLAYLASAGRNLALQQLVDSLLAIPQAAQHWHTGALALDPVYQPQLLVRRQRGPMQVRTLCTVIPQQRLRITQFIPDLGI